MASPTQWTWVWASSGSWWWTGKPGVLQSMGSQRVRHNWATELNWRFMTCFFTVFKYSSSLSTYNKDNGCSFMCVCVCVFEWWWKYHLFEISCFSLCMRKFYSNLEYISLLMERKWPHSKITFPRLSFGRTPTLGWEPLPYSLYWRGCMEEMASCPPRFTLPFHNVDSLREGAEMRGYISHQSPPTPPSSPASEYELVICFSQWTMNRRNACCPCSRMLWLRNWFLPYTGQNDHHQKVYKQ